MIRNMTKTNLSKTNHPAWDNYEVIPPKGGEEGFVYQVFDQDYEEEEE